MPASEVQLQTALEGLPGLDCGACGSRTCEEFARVLVEAPDEARRCIHLSGKTTGGCATTRTAAACPASRCYAVTSPASCASCGDTDEIVAPDWKDSLGREFDFILDTLANEPGPRETILPHNPQLTKEMGIARGDILIGRPLGMSCGCLITHCGVVMNVDTKNGVTVWCVTGPLGPRAGAHKDSATTPPRPTKVW